MVLLLTGHSHNCSPRTCGDFGDLSEAMRRARRMLGRADGQPGGISDSKRGLVLL